MLDRSRIYADAVAEVGVSQHDLSDPTALDSKFNKEQLMKRQIFDILVISLLLGLAAASAQAQSTIAKADIPFDFTIGDTRLPAGEYTIASGAPDVAPEMLMFRDGKGKVREVTMAARMEPGSNRSARLVFHRYGSRLFLAEAWLVAGESGCQVRQGSQEKELAERGTGVPEALILARAR
jgi:hypothetical protein